MKKQRRSIIAAIGKNREIGKRGDLLWHIPEDLVHFKQLTIGAPVIMGRATYLSIPEKYRPLPGRTNIVLTLPDDDYEPDSEVIVAHSLPYAFARAAEEPVDEIFVIGGGSVYQQVIATVDRLYLTCIDAQDSEADTFFPDFSELFPKEISCEEHDNGTYKYSFVVLEK